jgi:hypothetical protein
MSLLLPTAPRDPMLPFKAFCSHLWSPKELHGPLWLLMAFLGPHNLMQHGSMWPHAAVCDPNGYPRSPTDVCLNVKRI